MKRIWKLGSSSIRIGDVAWIIFFPPDIISSARNRARFRRLPFLSTEGQKYHRSRTMYRRQGARTIDRADSSILDLSEKLRFLKICERWMRMKRRLIFFFFLPLFFFRPLPPIESNARTHARPSSCASFTK